MHKSSTRILCAVLVATAIAALSGIACAEIKTETVTYKAGNIEAHGFLAYDSSFKGKRPGILVVPEFWGLNNYPKTRARMLATLGYVAFVADMYGDGKFTTDPKQASKWAGELLGGDRAELRTRIRAALKKLKSEPMVDPDKIAAIGYCFGGTTVLELARSGANLAGVVSFHGVLSTPVPAKPGVIKAKILVCDGAEDPLNPPAVVDGFENEMRKAKANWEVIVYGGAMHGFTNPANINSKLHGVAYNKEADQRSWRAMQDFFNEIFKK